MVSTEDFDSEDIGSIPVTAEHPANLNKITCMPMYTSGPDATYRK